jgi:hypothetical protein
MTIDEAQERARRASLDILRAMALLHSAGNVEAVALPYRQETLGEDSHRHALLDMALDRLESAFKALEPIS